MTEYPKEYTLTFWERLIFQTIFPPTDGKGHYTEQVLRDKVLEKLISPEERTARELAPILTCPKCALETKSDKKLECPRCEVAMQDSKRVGWNLKDKDGNLIPDEKAVSFGEMTVKTITKALKELDEAGAIGAEHKSLYLKVVLEGKAPSIEA